MSYDLDVITVTCHHTKNYTSNVAPMFYLAFERTSEYLEPILKKAWYPLDDFKEALNCGEREIILPTLKFMITDMKAYPEIYKSLNPENGWGTYEGALEFLEEALKALEKNKKSIIRLSW